MILRPGLLAALLLVVACTAPRDPHDGALQGVVELGRRVIAAEVGGRLVEVALVRGARVAEGAVVARVDSTVAVAARAARAADVVAARAQLALVSAPTRREDKDALAAQIRAARAAENLIRVDLERARRLLDKHAAPRTTVDQLGGQLERAIAERQVIEERYQALKHGARAEEIQVAEARVASAEAALAVEDTRVAQYAVRAPVAATVLDVIRVAGEVVAPGGPIAIVADTGRPFVDVFVPEDRLAGISVGQPATVETDAGVTATGAVEHIAAAAEFTPRFLFSERERHSLVVRVRIRIVDPDAALHAGLPAFVRLGAAPAPAPR